MDDWESVIGQTGAVWLMCHGHSGDECLCDRVVE